MRDLFTEFDFLSRLLPMVFRFSIVIILFFILIEGTFRVFQFYFSDNIPYISNNRYYREVIHLKLKRELGQFNSTMFCDIMHTTTEGHFLEARFIYNQLPLKEYKNIWAVGGSTTEGKLCSAKTNWVQNLNARLPNPIITNLGKSGKYSDYSIKQIEENVANGNIPDMILWGQLINEILINGDSNDLNFNLLKNKFNLNKNSFSTKLSMFFTRIDYTFYHNSASYRFATNIINHIMFSVSNSNVNNKQKIRFSEMNEDRDKIIYFSEAFHQDKNLFMNYIFENYSINLKRLNDLSIKYHIKIVILYLPYIHHYFSRINPAFNDFYENKYMPQLKSLTMKKCKEYNWQFIDVDQMFIGFSVKR